MGAQLDIAVGDGIQEMRVVPHFKCESGAQLERVEVVYATWGTLNAAKDNAIVICHALTGNADAGDVSQGQGWWSPFIGPGKPIDTNRYYVICSNVLGGCNGTTGPASLAPDGQIYGLRFPLVTVRDMVRLQIELLNQLAVRGIHAVIGGSLGGMQVWEWALLDPLRVRNAIAIAAHAAFPPLAIGYNAAMRQAIVSDPEWNQGRYYESNRAPTNGLALARTIGLLTYRANELYESRFERRSIASDRRCQIAEGMTDSSAEWTTEGVCVAGELMWSTNHRTLTAPEFEVESYLTYNGNKFVNRFDANSYLYLTKAMDGHDIGRGRGGLRAALGNIRCRLTLIGIATDYLYEPKDLARTAELASSVGVQCSYNEIASPYGHDAFLVDSPPLRELIRQRIEGV